MKISPLSISSLVGALAFMSQPVAANFKRCISDIDYTKDYFPVKITPIYSQNWDISYHNTYKIITNKSAGSSYLLYQCGSTPPVSEEGKHTLTLSVPLQDGLVLSSTTQIPHLEQLGLRRQIKGWLGDTQYISSPCLKTMVEEDAVKTLFDPTSYTTVGQSLDDFLAERSDAVVLRGYTSGSNSFAMTESSEAESLDIYEWHKVYGALFNLEETANEQFDEAEARYQCNSQNAAYIAQQRRTAIESEKPTVVWAYHSTYSEPNYWDVARCDEKNLYYCEYASRCAATLLHSNEGSIANTWTDGDFHMTDEEFFAFAKDADHWIYTAGNWDATFDKFKTELSEFKSVKDEEVYDTEGSGNGAWFEQRLAEFDIVLQDFCDVVGHYEYDNVPPHSRKYFRKVVPAGVEPVPASNVCEAGFVDLPWESRASQCVFLNNPNEEEEEEESAAVDLSFRFAMLVGIISSIASLGLF